MMRDCSSCGILHSSNEEMHQFLLNIGYKDTYVERMNRQKNYCRFGEQGICCTLCPDGPCRIRRRAPLGRCGIDADGISARNLLRLVINGGSAYTHDFKYTLKTLKAMSEGKSPFSVRGDVLRNIYVFLEREFIKDTDEPLDIVKSLAPKSRVELWDIGVLDPDYVNIVVHGHVPWTGSVVAKLAKEESFQELARKSGAKGIKVYGSLCTGQELIQRPETSGYIDGQVGNWLSQEFVAGTGVVDVFVLDKNCSAPGLNNLVNKLKLHTKLIPVSSVVRLREVKANGNMNYDPVNVEEQAKYIILSAIEAYKQRKRTPYPRYVPDKKTEYIAGFGIESILSALGGSPDPLFEVIEKGLIKGVVGLVSCVTMRNGHGSFTYEFLKELLKRDILVLIAGCASSMAQVEGFTNLEAIDKFAGEGLKAVCKTLNIPPVLNFGSCLDTGRMILLITALSQYKGVDPSKLPVVACAPEYYNNDALIDGLLGVAMGVNVFRVKQKVHF